jgi:hypothetical protein
MIKYFFCLFTIIILSPCNSHSQTKPEREAKLGIVIIDKSIKKRFFKVPPRRHESGVGEVRINSYIRDTARSLPLFDTCRCSRRNDDSLILEFKSILAFKYDTIRIIVVNDTYSAYYIRAGAHHKAVSGTLIFHHKPGKKGQEIYGELGFEFNRDRQNSIGFFKGPFRCAIE